MDKWLIRSGKKRPHESDSACPPSEIFSPNKEQGSNLNKVHCSSASTSAPIRIINSTHKVKVRKYQDDYLTLGFTSILSNNNQEQPQCVLCLEILANDSLKPVKLKRHLQTKHPDCVSKPLAFFKRHEQQLKGNVRFLEKHATVPKKALRASLEVSYLIAKSKSPHIIGEKLLLPAAVKMCAIMHGEKFGECLKSIPLSNDTVTRRIDVIASDIKNQLLPRLHVSPKFALQLDDSTDIVNSAQLLVFVRYCHENEMHEDFLFCKALEGRTTGEDIFSLVNSFFIDNNLSWTNCVGICTDGASAFTGTKKGFRARVSAVTNSVKFTHCMIHREALASKVLQPEVNKVLNDVISVVNFVKARALNSRLFSILCEEMGSTHDSLLLHTEVRWLSRGRVLRRVVELKNELRIFLLDSSPTLATLFLDEKWLLILCYLADVFEKLNELNVSLQGRNSNIFILSDKVLAFKRKLELWKAQMDKGNCEMFHCLNEFLEENELDICQISGIVVEHLQNLRQKFEGRFPQPSTENDWIRSPFETNVTAHLSTAEQEELIELSSDRILRNEFKSKSLENFWVQIRNEYPILSRKAVDLLLPFASTYLCESTFSAMASVKTKHRSRLQLEGDLRVAVSNIQPRLDLLSSQIQAHTSH